MNPAASVMVIGSGMVDILYSGMLTFAEAGPNGTRCKVAILGGSGYTAVELIKILLRHPRAEIAAVTSRQDEHIAELHPSLLGRLDLRCEPFDPDKLKAKGVQVAFGCLPHGASMESIPPLLERGIRVVDLSADYRLRDPNVYEEWYKEPHHDAANLAQAVYGLPEVYGDDINGAKLVANPGCYPQTAILGLAPLVAKGLIEPTGIIVDSKSGVSGAGRTPKLTTHFPECNESVSAYAVGTHRHTPEIEQALSDVARQAGGGDLHAAPDADGPRHLSDDLRHADAAGDRGGAESNCTASTTRASRSCACGRTCRRRRTRPTRTSSTSA